MKGHLIEVWEIRPDEAPQNAGILEATYSESKRRKVSPQDMLVTVTEHADFLVS